MTNTQRCYLLLLILAAPLAAEGEPERKEIQKSVAAFLAPICDESVDFSWRVQGQGLDVAFARKGSEEFTLWVRSEPVTFLLRRGETQAELILPEHKLRFLAKGELRKDAESLAPLGFVGRLLGQRNQAPALARLWLMGRLATAKPSSDGGLTIDDKIRLGLGEGGSLQLHSSARRGFFEGISELRSREFRADTTTGPFGS